MLPSEGGVGGGVGQGLDTTLSGRDMFQSYPGELIYAGLTENEGGGHISRQR